MNQSSSSVINYTDVVFFFSSRRRHTRYWRDWSSDVCSSDLGAVLGEVGLFAATHLMGVVGFALGPVAAVGGLLLLVRVLSGRVALGVLLFLVAVATTLAARIPARLRFASEAYTEAGGVVGSGLYGAVDWAGGSIGAALALLLLYALGLSLLTGVTPTAAANSVRGGLETLLAWLRERRESRSAEREVRSARPSGTVDYPEEVPPLPEPPYEPEDVSETEKTRELDRKSTRLNSSHANISYAVF